MGGAWRRFPRFGLQKKSSISTFFFFSHYLSKNLTKIIIAKLYSQKGLLIFEPLYLSIAFRRCCSSLLLAKAVNFAISLASISFNLPAMPGSLRSNGLPSLVFNFAFIFSSLWVMSLEMSVVITVAKWGSLTNNSSRAVRGHTKHRVATAAHTVTYGLNIYEFSVKLKW